MSAGRSARTSQALARSALTQLIGKGFAHPDADFHNSLRDRTWQEAVARLGRQIGVQADTLPACRDAFPDYEAGYIALFQHGRKGRPEVSLHSGDYPELLAGKTRAEHMLDCLAWYRHFGLKLPADPAPAADHIVCQFDFLAWLAWLEDGAAAQGEAQEGYRRAQRDFLEIQLIPLLRVMRREFGPPGARGGTAEGFGRLIRLALDAAERISTDLEPSRSGHGRRPGGTRPKAERSSPTRP